MHHLRSGHSHEDLDQIFGGCALWIVKKGGCIQTPMQFCSIIQNFALSADRPHEPSRSVMLLDQHRPWTLGKN